MLRAFEGAIVVHIGGDEAPLAAGDELTLPVGIPHAVGGASAEARRVIAARAP
ncbi:MAG: hypothetical protein R6W48_05750 [Gaiellaceae bacterium]